MLVVGAVELVLMVVLLGLLITQIAWPIMHGTKWFPAVRRREVRAEARDAADDLDAEEERDRAIRLRRRADHLKVRRDGGEQ